MMLCSNIWQDSYDQSYGFAKLSRLEIEFKLSVHGVSVITSFIAHVSTQSAVLVQHNSYGHIKYNQMDLTAMKNQIYNVSTFKGISYQIFNAY